MDPLTGLFTVGQLEEEAWAMPQKKNYAAPAAACAAEVLRVLRTANAPVSLADLERMLPRTKSLIFRVLRELADKELVMRDPNGRYRLGIEAFEIGAAYLSQADSTEIVRQVLQELAYTAGETVNLGVLRDNEVLYVMKFLGPKAFVTISRVGGRVPANCIAIGKILLAELTEDQLQRAFTEPLPQLTHNSIQSMEDLMTELRRTRARGYAVDEEEAVLGRCGLAVLTRGPTPSLHTVAISLSTERESFDERSEELLKHLVSAAERIEREMAARVPLASVGGN